MDGSTEQLRIVVADDSAVYRKLVENTLGNEQYAVVCGKNGHEAIELVSAHQPAVVITDWEMPDITGLQLCEQLRRNPDNLFTYIILLTSKDEKDNIIKGLAAGADDYLTKPFHPGELLARVAVGR